MGTTLTSEELELLNILLGKMNLKDKFSINNLHAVNVLKEKYPRGDGGVGLRDYDAARKDFTDRGVYLHITNWLIEQGFVTIIPTSGIFNELRLTGTGEVLWAYGDCIKYFNSLKSSPQEEIIKRVPKILELASPFGEFTIVHKVPNVQYLNINIFNPNDDEERKKVDDAISGRSNLILLHEESLKDEEVLQYLIKEGFAINRHDIKVEGKTYRQLTDKGRDLKELGSIEGYNAHLKMEIQKALDKEYDLKKIDLRNQHLYWINFWIMIGALSAGVYYCLEILRVQYKLGLPHHIFFR